VANYADDFESYGTGSTIPTGYTGRWNYAAGEWDRVSDTDIAVRQVETSLSRTAVSMNAVDSDGNRAEVEILARFKSTVGTGSDLRGGVVVRGSGSAGSETGYTCGIFANDLRIGRYKAGASLQNAITSGLGLSGSAVYYWIRFRVSGTGSTVTLKARIWLDGNPEPDSSTWTLETTDTSADRITAAGWCGMFGFADGTRHWRDLAVATNGDTASMSGGGGDVSVSITGTASTTSAGSLAPTLSLSISGNASTASPGTLTAVVGGSGVTVSISGSAATATAGSLVAALSIAAGGVSSSAQAGDLVGGFVRAITGNSTTASAGTVTRSQSIQLLGIQLSGQAGSVAAVGGVTQTPKKGLRKTRYVPGRVPTQQAELIRFLQSELERLNDALESPFTHQLLEVLNTEPARKRDGMVAMADGTNWAPDGLGKGVFVYYDGAWSRLG